MGEEYGKETENVTTYEDIFKTKEERTITLDDYVDVTEILKKCEIFQLVFSAFSCFIYFPIKHYREYKIDQFKSLKAAFASNTQPPNPCSLIFGPVSLLWLVGMYTFTILIATKRLTP